MTTTVVLVLWATVTLGATPLAPLVAAGAEWVEVKLGLDVMPGARADADVEREAGP